MDVNTPMRSGMCPCHQHTDVNGRRVVCQGARYKSRYYCFDTNIKLQKTGLDYQTGFALALPNCAFTLPEPV
jgi:hypothetical protein